MGFYKKKPFNQEEQKITRVRLPKRKEVLGIIEQRLGGNKVSVVCLDGKARNCRVPGRLKRKLWLRPDDIVIVNPWDLDDTKADVLFKFKPAEVQWLRKNNYLETEKVEF